MPLRGLQYLESRAIWDGHRRFDLSAPLAVMEKLGRPQDSIPSIHVAGTNGKGSVSAMLASIFHCGGRRVAQLSSPHLGSVTERCTINGIPVEQKLFERAVDQVAAAAASVGRELSYFELVVAASFVAAQMAVVELMVVEVGLGGTNDATNVIRRPLAAVITSIGLDHMNILGTTLPEIAAVKAGIIKPGVPVICGEIPAEAQAVIDAAARAEAAGPVFRCGRDFDISQAGSAEAFGVRVAGRTIDLGGGSDLLRATFQRRNAAVAAATAATVGATDEEIRRGIARTRWPGRIETVTAEFGGSSCRFLLDVAHNRDGITALLEYIDAELADLDRIVLVLSILDRKEWRYMLSQIRQWTMRRPRTVELIFTRADDPRVVPPADLSAEFGSGETAEDPLAAVALAVDRCSGIKSSLVLVTGSLFLVGQIRRALLGSEFRTIAPE